MAVVWASCYYCGDRAAAAVQCCDNDYCCCWLPIWLSLFVFALFYVELFFHFHCVCGLSFYISHWWRPTWPHYCRMRPLQSCIKYYISLHFISNETVALMYQFEEGSHRIRTHNERHYVWNKHYNFFVSYLIYCDYLWKFIFHAFISA